MANSAEEILLETRKLYKDHVSTNPNFAAGMDTMGAIWKEMLIDLGLDPDNDIVQQAAIATLSLVKSLENEGSDIISTMGTVGVDSSVLLVILMIGSTITPDELDIPPDPFIT